MHTTIQLIELAKQRLAQEHGLELPMSDYRFMKLTGYQQSTISKWTSGKSRIGMEFAGRFAELTGLPAAYVLACLEHERHSDPTVRRIFADIAEAFRGKAAALVMAMLATGMYLAAPENPEVFAGSFVSPTTYYAPLLATLAAAFLLTAYFRSASSSRHARRMNVKAWMRFFTVFPVAVLATGCTALQTPEERTWLAVHAIDSAQTYRIAQDDGRCFHEADPLTSQMIGRFPSRTSVVAWSMGSAAAHAAVTEVLLQTEHPRLAKAWQYLTLGVAGHSTLRNYQIGIRIGSHNKPLSGCVR